MNQEVKLEAIKRNDEKDILSMSYSGRDKKEGAPKDTELYLVRHGETEWNVQSKYQGQKDSKLTQKGIDQAVKIGKRLAYIHKTEGKFAKVYVSSLGRAKHTAKLILDQFDDKDSIECVFVAELVERSFGKFEGLTNDEVGEAAASSMHFGAADFKPGETGESQQEMLDRCLGALTTIYKENRGKRILVVTHGGVISSSIGYVLSPEMPFRRRTFFINNGTICVIQFSEKDKSWMLAKLNDEGFVLCTHGNAQENGNNIVSQVKNNSTIILYTISLMVGLGAVFGYRRYFKST